MKIRILQVIGGLNRGGAETMLMNLYRNINRDKFVFDFLVYYPENKPQDYEEEIRKLGGNVIHIPNDNPFSMFINTLRIFRVNKYDVVHAHTLFNSASSILAARICKVPMRITHAHSTGSLKKENISMKIYINISKAIIRKYSTHYFACGKDAGEYLFGKELFRLKGYVLKNGIDLSLFKTYKKQNLLEEKSFIKVGCIGSFHKVKNHQFLIKFSEWMKENQRNDIKFVFVGKGNLENTIKNMIKENYLDDYFEFLGTRDDIYNIMNDLDVLVMPSLYEGLPVTLVEAQACGLPCVVSNTISSEVDLGLNLVKFLSISEDDENLYKWYKCLHSICNTKNAVEGDEKIYKVMTDKGYNIKNTSLELEGIYGKIEKI